MHPGMIRLFLCLLLFWFGLGNNCEVAFAGEPLPPRKNRVEMQVGPNSTPNPADDDSADTLRVGPGNNRPRENNRNLYPDFAGDVRVEIQLQPDGHFWPRQQPWPDNFRPPAHNRPRPGQPENGHNAPHRPGDRPESRPGDRPEFRPGDRPEFRPGDRPEFRPGDRPLPDRRPPVERGQRPVPQVQPVAPERRR